MFDPQVELVAFLAEHGVHGWVTGQLGQRLLVDDWADWFIGEVAAAANEEGADAVERLAGLRAILDAPPGRKTIIVAKIREVLDQ